MGLLHSNTWKVLFLATYEVDSHIRYYLQNFGCGIHTKILQHITVQCNKPHSLTAEKHLLQILGMLGIFKSAAALSVVERSQIFATDY